MSRGFVKEDDQEETPFVPPRAPLPDGVPNHVTVRGARLLLEERERLEQLRAVVQGSEEERRRERAAIEGRLALLNERIVTARPIEPAPGPPADIRFGTSSTILFHSGPLQGSERTFTIVGVDEANATELRISFISPMARALIGHRTGDRFRVRLGSMEQEMEVRRIEWAGP